MKEKKNRIRAHHIAIAYWNRKKEVFICTSVAERVSVCICVFLLHRHEFDNDKPSWKLQRKKGNAVDAVNPIESVLKCKQACVCLSLSSPTRTLCLRPVGLHYSLQVSFKLLLSSRHHHPFSKGHTLQKRIDGKWKRFESDITLLV